MATGLNRLGAAAYVNTPPAIIQEAKRDWKFYQGEIIKLDENKGKLLKEYKDSGVWKQNYKSWAAACVPLELSKRQVDKLISQEREAEVGTPVPTVANKEDKEEQKALSQVEAAREEKEEEPEKPAVHSADEKKREEPKPRNNGKPKTDLAIWRELEESLFGRALNRADELNRQCPNKVFHSQLIACTKSCMAVLENWKESVQ